MGSWGREGSPGRRGRRSHPTRRAGLCLAALLTLAATACGDDSGAAAGDPGDQNAEAPTTTGLPACEDNPRLVIFHINGVLTAERTEFNNWLDEPGYVMQTRAGAPELAEAYHERGFHVVYATRGDSDLEMHGTPYVDAMTAWLISQNFPIDERAYLQEGFDPVTLSDALGAARNEGGGGYAAYTTVEDDLPALQVAGVPAERIYGLEDLAGTDGTTTLPGDDLNAHLSEVEALEPVCNP
jgi:hypothetical protein